MSCRRISWAAELVLASLSFIFAAADAAAQPWNVTLVSETQGTYEAVGGVGRYAYLGGHNSRYEGIFRILDVSNLALPVELGSLLLPPSYVHGVHTSGSVVYLANGISGLRIVDVANPSSPTLRSTCAAPRDAGAVFVSGHLAYVADGFDGLKIIDVANPTSPTLCGSYNTPDLAVDVFVSGGLAYVADRASLVIIDVTNPTSPTLRGCYSNTSWGPICNVFVSNGVAYVTATAGDYWSGYYARFLSLDITNPAAPRLLGSYGTPGVAGGVYVSNGLAHVCLGNGLRIFNVGTPSSPVLRGFYPVDFLSWGYGRVFVTGNLAYVAGNRQGLLILRYTGPPAAASRWRMYR